MEYKDVRYVIGTVFGKPLYIKREPKTNQIGKIEYSYGLTPDLTQATKCVNKETADTLLEFYLDATKSDKAFISKKLIVTYHLQEEENK